MYSKNKVHLTCRNALMIRFYVDWFNLCYEILFNPIHIHRKFLCYVAHLFIFVSNKITDNYIIREGIIIIITINVLLHFSYYVMIQVNETVIHFFCFITILYLIFFRYKSIIRWSQFFTQRHIWMFIYIVNDMRFWSVIIIKLK